MTLAERFDPAAVYQREAHTNAVILIPQWREKDLSQTGLITLV